MITKLQEKRAWLRLAKRFRAGGAGDWYPFGMCYAVNTMVNNAELRKHMHKKLSRWSRQLGFSMYRLWWTTNSAGHQRRAYFCAARARYCR